MFGLGTTELVIIALVVLLLFGGKRLPALGRSMGSAITNFKKGLKQGEVEDKTNTKDDDSQTG